MKIFISLLIVSALALGLSLDYFNILDREVGEPLYRLSISAAIPFLIVLLLSKGNILRAWVRFSRWWIPLSILLILLAPTSSGTWMPILSMTKESLTWLMGGLFTIISLVIIARANRTSRTPKKS
jgi:predicted permease